MSQGLEKALTFECEDRTLCAILHGAASRNRCGMLVVVGGPNYRVGSHRQFLQLARHLADAGYPVLRFDYRGMGDSAGEVRSFEHVHDDIRAAVDCFFEQTEGLEQVVLFGLCDGASASVFYAPSDPRIKGLVLVNPWVREEQSEARAYLKHYYTGRLSSGTFWKRLVGGDLSLRSSIASVIGLVKRAATRSTSGEANLAQRMADGLDRFNGPVLLILSGADLTAAEFTDTTGRSRQWRRLLEADRVDTYDIPDADHTLARSEWRDQMLSKVAAWLSRFDGPTALGTDDV